MLIAGAAAAALLVGPGLSRCVALATDRRPDPRLFAAVAFAAALLVAWRAESPLHGAALALTAAMGIVAGWIDAYERRLPDVLVLPAYPAVAALLLATADPDAMLRAAACAGAGAVLYLAGHAVGQVGFGDVKLAGLLGLVLGWTSWEAAAIAVVAVVVIGGMQAIAVLALRRSEFPLGPAMLLGASAALVITNMGITH
ncbi:prepilin peptidase [Glycomyces arizonensis]|uniref:prepilin peptidase n=1 Tax=Glycomyces arizonensis TaxID=256035 RepID=UPI0003FBEC5F|nr:prepilin peptidase [Glycomyces arizonensis]